MARRRCTKVQAAGRGLPGGKTSVGRFYGRPTLSLRDAAAAREIATVLYSSGLTRRRASRLCEWLSDLVALSTMRSVARAEVAVAITRAA
jgi:hypothetical protein